MSLHYTYFRHGFCDKFLLVLFWTFAHFSATFLGLNGYGVYFFGFSGKI